MKTETWLPVFSGFYESMWSGDNDREREIDYINELRKEKGFPKIGYDDIEWSSYSEYMERVGRAVTSALWNELHREGFVSKIKFQEIKSPKYYNYSTDSINVAIELTEENQKVIAAYLETHKMAFAKYLKDTYTSRSGFISSYDNDIEGFIGDDIHEALGHKHKLESILQFICNNEDIDEWGLYDRVTGNIEGLYAENFEDLVSGRFSVMLDEDGSPFVKEVEILDPNQLKLFNGPV